MVGSSWSVEQTLPTAERRRPRIGDAMILMVALAVGLAVARIPLSHIGQWFALITPTRQPFWMDWWTEIAGRRGGFRFLVFQGCVQLLYCFIVPLTPALMVARLRRPRPPLRRVAFQPGFVALSLTAIIGLIDVDLTFFALVAFPPMVEMVLPGAAVLASWMILVALGRWHPEAGWIDRSGRLVGAFWLAMIPWSIWLQSF